MAFCKMCGSNIPEGVKFCPACGAASEAAQPVQQPEPQVTYQQPAQPQYTEYVQPQVQQSSYRFPVAALIFSILTLIVWTYTLINGIANGFRFSLNSLQGWLHISFALAHVGLFLGICLSKVKGNIITGITFLLYATFEIIADISNFEYFTYVGNTADAIILICNILVVLFFLLVGLHYVLGGRGMGKPIRIIFTVLFLLSALTVFVVTVATDAEYLVKEAPELLISYILGFIRNLFLGLAVLSFSPKK